MRIVPASVQRRDGKYRVVEPDGTLVTDEDGNAVDGGGHDSREAAMAQARAINAQEAG